ncbi:hypothetical protein BGZ80_005861 [Entomortierella chlamydospora]|uniref:Uncharacterized protein n=1 Tax=Entomortierella chlamydospora TaxID=101097 RepID=A0A9P6MZ61_9FUNG|nr:hypothetical protein BGZ80_005861 [Entomortierella chlamydospora]
MTVPEQGPRQAPQTFRAVYRHGTTSTAVPYAPTTNINPRFDAKSGQYIILWSDVQRVFQDAQYALDGAEMVPFLVDDNWEELKPLRILANPGVVLDVALDPNSSSRSLYAIMGDVLRVSSSLSDAAANDAIGEGSAASGISLPGLTQQDLPVKSGQQTETLYSRAEKTPNVLHIGVGTGSGDGLYSRGNHSETSLSSSDSANTFYSADENWSGPSRRSSQSRLSQIRSPTVPDLAALTNHSEDSVSASPTDNEVPDVVSSSNAPLAETEQEITDITSIEATTSEAIISSRPVGKTVTPVLSKEVELESSDVEVAVSIPDGSKSRNIWSPQSKRILNRRGPQANVDPPNLADAPEDIQGRVVEYMEQLESLTWHEAPMPRLYDHPDGAEDCSGHGSSSYLQHTHQGFELNQPLELFKEYGVHLLLNLQLFMYSKRSLTTGNDYQTSPRRKTGLSYDQGVEFLQNALGMQKEQIEHSLNWMIDYLFSRALESTMENQLLHVLDGEIQKPPKLTPDDLVQLRSFISLPPNGPGTYGNLYRSVDDDGHVQWVCSTHFYELHPFFSPEYIHEAVQECGGYDYAQGNELASGLYNAQTGSIGARPRSNIEALHLYSALVAGIKCVPEVCLRFHWNVALEDMGLIRDAVVNFGVVSLSLMGPGLRHASAAHSELMIQIMMLPRIQMLVLDSAQAVLKHVHPLLLTKQFPGLRALHLQLDAGTGDLDDIASGLTSAIVNSPNITELSINWEEFEEILDIEAFLQKIAVNRLQAICVVLKVRMQEVTLTINNEEFHNVKLKSSNLFIAGTNPLIHSGHVETLTIADPSDTLGPEDGSELWSILSLNRRLRLLALDTDSNKFQSVGNAVRHIINTLRPNCVLSQLFLKDSLKNEPVSPFLVVFPPMDETPFLY